MRNPEEIARVIYEMATYIDDCHGCPANCEDRFAHRENKCIKRITKWIMENNEDEIDTGERW